MTIFLRSHPLLQYFIIAFAVFWGCLALGLLDRFLFWVPILGPFAPALAAIVVSGLSAGESEVRALLRRLGVWRVVFGWYLVALGLPVAEDIFAAGLAALRGAFSATRISPVLRVQAMWVVFVFAAGEELGWRGFALPRLLASRTGLEASLILGTLHAVWHWPLILVPHQWLSGVPLLPYTLFIVSEAIVFTWIVQNTRGSILMATLFHGSSNLAMLRSGIDRAWAPWLQCLTWTLVALGVLLWSGPNLRRERRQHA